MATRNVIIDCGTHGNEIFENINCNITLNALENLVRSRLPNSSELCHLLGPNNEPLDDELLKQILNSSTHYLNDLKSSGAVRSQVAGSHNLIEFKFKKPSTLLTTSESQNFNTLGFLTLFSHLYLRPNQYARRTVR
jgi:hypothetical protein